jgi:acetate kinase
VDTSMGLTPTGGIMNSTRAGDLDPGVMIYLMRKNLDAAAMETLVDKESGLLAVGGSKDMRELETAIAGGDAKAQLAVDMFGRAIAKTVAGYASVLGGIDLFAFAGGIGENSAMVRANVCARLVFLGVTLDDARNKSSAAILSADGSRCAVRIVPSEEEKQIARYVRELLKS